MDFSEVTRLDEFHGFNAGHNRHINGPTHHLEICRQFTMNIYEPDLFVYDIDWTWHAGFNVTMAVWESLWSDGIIDFGPMLQTSSSKSTKQVKRGNSRSLKYVKINCWNSIVDHFQIYTSWCIYIYIYKYIMVYIYMCVVCVYIYILI